MKSNIYIDLVGNGAMEISFNAHFETKEVLERNF